MPFFTYGFTMTFFHLVDTDTIIRQAGAMEKPSMLIQCHRVYHRRCPDRVSSRHQIRQGVRGYLLGNF